MGIISVTLLENGIGYWGKFSEIQNVSISGQIVNSNEVSVNQGWNIIGVFDNEVTVSSITQST